MLRRIAPRFVDKPWGTPDITPWFTPREGKTGEVWFENETPLMVKFIFTSERLSVQVHPNDQQAGARGLRSGKTELWHVLRAAPGAEAAIGFHREITREQARAASLDGSILELLDWRPARAGDTFFLPAGTVHALGAGLAICEIAQNVDVTYRLYDYGRGRELHLEDGLAVACLSPSPTFQISPHWLAAGDAFQIHLMELDRPFEETMQAWTYRLFAVLEGEGTIGGAPFRAGECWVAEGLTQGFSIEPAVPSRLLAAGHYTSMLL